MMRRLKWFLFTLRGYICCVWPYFIINMEEELSGGTTS